ncbi:GTPase RsgA [Thermococcus sp. GR7]|uniref:GTPase n=1 Tax=unclassified Thermococcus TaxID=2627626 RepID=UPI0014305114|nr:MULTISPECIES: GTPase [unclassified Thermococcus]NJE46108.1 GTPase RsgA [Thermococcus sp. GR7]NJE78256.1 GTPase RsgA [Thermococcus sp. GR4]NJF22305.1 GTPase RsgA [Thermococcus sp. GR5]
MKQRKAWRVVREVIDEADIIVEVVDARDPIGTRNRKLERLVQEEGKPLLIVMNKADLVPKEWAEEYKRKSEIPVVFISARERRGTGILRREIKKLAKGLLDEQDKVKVALIGYPNVGKSTIINTLKGKKAVGTAPIPGYTKGKQLIRLSKKIWLLDSPGVVPIDDFDELVIKGGFPADKIEEPVKPALKLIGRILETRKEALTEKFGIEDFSSEEDILREIGKRKGIIRKGGEVDLEETARWLLREWQTGRFTLFGKEEEKGQEFVWDFEDVLDGIEKDLLLDPRRILWKYGEELREKLDNTKRVGIREIEGFTVGIATGFKKCDGGIKLLEKLTGKHVLASECFGKKWKGVVVIME